jgi:uncharacterized membrane protein YphA (DoxX/SURF4 family)
MPHFHMSRDLERVRTIVSVAMVAGLVLSLPLWFSPQRLYPTAPMIPALPPMPALIEALLLGAALAGLALGRRGVFVSLATLALFVVWDQSRLQPWLYQYAAILAVVALVRDRARALATCRFIVAAVYFWSGLQKANAAFIDRVWPDVAASLVAFAPAVRAMAISVPIVECTIAIGLLTPRFRRAAAWTAVAVHAFILVLLVASSENSVVWPWNVCMALLVVTLFGASRVASRSILLQPSAGHACAVVLFGLMPALSFVGLWDAYLSSALYSGNTQQAMIYVMPGVVEHLPPVIRDNTWQMSAPMYIDLNRWSYAELNVPTYPAARVFRRAASDVCRHYAAFGEMELRILDRPDWRTGQRRSQFYRCGGESRSQLTVGR